MKDYEVSLVLNDGLVRMESRDYGRQLWSSGAARKVKGCCICLTPPPVKSITWKPITNGLNRMDRICSNCMTKMSDGKDRYEAS